MEIKFEMYKIIGGRKEQRFEFEAMSDKHAIIVAEQFKEKNGLIGRYYCETSSAFCFSV